MMMMTMSISIQTSHRDDGDYDDDFGEAPFDFEEAIQRQESGLLQRHLRFRRRFGQQHRQKRR